VKFWRYLCWAGGALNLGLLLAVPLLWQLWGVNFLLFVVGAVCHEIAAAAQARRAAARRREVVLACKKRL